jgi:hypothetical protein
MNCITCSQPLDLQKSGFVVCSNCGTVNLPQSAATPLKQISDSPVVSGAVVPEVYSTPIVNVRPRLRLTKQKLIIAGGIFGLVLLLFLSMGGFFLYQNSQAAGLLHAARDNIGSGNYETSLKQLDSAQRDYSFASVHRQIISLKAKDKAWATDNQELQLAIKLSAQGKYNQAAAQLKKIGKDFPGYRKVLALSANIAAKQAAASKVAPVAAATTVPQPVRVVPKSSSSAAAPGTILPKRFTRTAAAGSLASSTSVAQAQQALQSFASQYNLTMEITGVAPSSYASHYATYNLLSDTDLGALKTYGALFIDEWAKYPTDWVANSKLSSIVIVKNLAISGTHRAAAPDPVGKTMYYDAGYSGDYAREVLHHEFDHLITYDDFGSYAPSDPTWQSYNTPSFSYGNGGAACYQPDNNCLSGQHPVSGFVTGYATSAIEEDKAELYAYLMTGTYYHQLVSWLPSDARLANKVNNYKQFISSHSPEMSGNYFNDINP